MILRPATSLDSAFVESAADRLAQLGTLGTKRAIAAGMLSPFVLEADSGRRALLLLAVNWYGPGTPSLWVAGAYCGEASTAPERGAAQRLLQRLARKLGCRRVEFSSMRRGWQRSAHRFGFEPTATVYAQEVR